jgi:hypothetical protein
LPRPARNGAQRELWGQATGETTGKDRFEVSGIKAVRPTLVNTIAALKKGDGTKARAAFDDWPV